MILFALLLVSACGNDECERLCVRASNRLDACLAEWPATWEDLDAASQAGFLNSCQEGWREERADLEPRELEDALDQCQEAFDALATMRQDGTACDQLRALYLE